MFSFLIRKSALWIVISSLTLLVVNDPVRGEEANPLSPYISPFPTFCEELLPEDEPYTEFLRQAARILALKNKTASTQALRILAYRDELQTELNWIRGASNSADTVIRAYLCHYFKNEARVGLTSSSPKIENFLRDKHVEIVDRIRQDILGLKKNRFESAQLQKELESHTKEFNSLREGIRYEVQDSLRKALPESNKTSK